MIFTFEKLACICLILFGVFVSCAVAEDSVPADKLTIGRLSDGRAFRTDQSGHRLVDQIAELEVTVSELTKQLRVLEAELNEKDRVNKNLAGSQTGTGRSTLRSVTSSLPPARSNDPPNCNELVSNLMLKVSELESSSGVVSGRNSVTSSSKTETATTRKEIPECDYNSPENPLWDQVAKLQAQLMKSPSHESYAIVTEELKEKDERIASLERELEAKLAQVESLKKEPKSLEVVEAPRAMMSASLGERAPEKVDTAGVTNPAIGEARAGLRKQLQSISLLINERKALYDRLQGNKASVSIKLQPLVTKKGESLDTLRARVTKLASAVDASNVHQGLQEIEVKLLEDKKVLQRLLKIS